MCVSMSVSKREAQHYYGNSSVLKVDMKDLGVYFVHLCVCAYSLARQPAVNAYVCVRLKLCV